MNIRSAAEKLYMDKADIHQDRLDLWCQAVEEAVIYLREENKAALDVVEAAGNQDRKSSALKHALIEFAKVRKP